MKRTIAIPPPSKQRPRPVFFQLEKWVRSDEWRVAKAEPSATGFSSLFYYCIEEEKKKKDPSRWPIPLFPPIPLLQYWTQSWQEPPRQQKWRHRVVELARASLSRARHHPIHHSDSYALGALPGRVTSPVTLHADESTSNPNVAH